MAQMSPTWSEICVLRLICACALSIEGEGQSDESNFNSVLLYGVYCWQSTTKLQCCTIHLPWCAASIVLWKRLPHRGGQKWRLQWLRGTWANIANWLLLCDVCGSLEWNKVCVRYCIRSAPYVSRDQRHKLEMSIETYCHSSKLDSNNKIYPPRQ